MELTTEDGTVLRDPGSTELQSALGRLGLPGNGYAILAKSSQHYIQVAGSKADGYIAEYREGSERTHHSSATSDLSHRQIVELLTAYLQGESSWKSMISWQPGFGDGPSRSRPSLVRKVVASDHTIIIGVFLAIGVLALGASAYFGFSTHRFLQRSVEAPGKVVRLVRSGTTYSPVVEYVDHRGHIQTLHSPQGSSPPSYFKGEEVTVLYDPADPKAPLSAKIATFGELWGAPIFLALFGAMFTGVALGIRLLLLRRRKAR